MADQLQPLIDRIQKEAVDDAEQQAKEILEQAQAKAKEIVRQAEEEATQKRTEAERDAEAFAERSQRTLDQAARDLLLSLEKGIDGVLSNLVAEELEPVLDAEGLGDLLGRLVTAYLEKEGAESRIEILVGPQDHEKLVQHFRQKHGAALKAGVTIEVDSAISKGFRVTVGEGSVSHDFTRESLVEALAAHLRPKLAEVIQKAS